MKQDFCSFFSFVFCVSANSILKAASQNFLFLFAKFQVFGARVLAAALYCLSKKSWPIFYSNLLNEMGQGFLGIIKHHSNTAWAKSILQAEVSRKVTRSIYKNRFLNRLRCVCCWLCLWERRGVYSSVLLIILLYRHLIVSLAEESYFFFLPNNNLVLILSPVREFFNDFSTFSLMELIFLMIVCQEKLLYHRILETRDLNARRHGMI